MSASTKPVSVATRDPGPFSAEEHLSFLEDGYVVLRAAISRALARELGQAMTAYVETVHRTSGALGAARPNGVVHMYHHPLQWELRQTPRIYEAFAQLWDDPFLWVSIDRGKLVPPDKQGGSLQKGFIHWDINTLAPPVPIPLQGLVALADTPSGHGGFQCVRGFPARFKEWAANQPVDRHPYFPDLEAIEIEQVAMSAGDLLIWNALLPHGNGENRSDTPRLVQFVRMYPCRLYDQTVRLKRLEMWNGRLPRDPSFVSPVEWDKPFLSPLGERLLGLTSWP